MILISIQIIQIIKEGIVSHFDKGKIRINKKSPVLRVHRACSLYAILVLNLALMFHESCRYYTAKADKFIYHVAARFCLHLDDEGNS